MKMIKRYRNRKLYDVDMGSYITLNEIRGFVRSGVSFNVFCHVTKNEITQQTLKQCVYECSELPRELLLSLIRY